MNHSFDTDVAYSIGINAAILLSLLEQKIAENAMMETDVYDGIPYVKMSHRVAENMIYYLSKKTIRIAFDKLISNGYITKKHGLNGDGFDRTSYYTTQDFIRGKRAKYLKKRPFAPEDKCICPTGQMATLSTDDELTGSDDKSIAPAPTEQVLEDEKKCGIEVPLNKDIYIYWCY